MEMLRDAKVTGLADVRAYPRSRSNPAFNVECFSETLAANQIDYHHFPALGGRRSRQPNVKEEINAYWRVRSFHNYADYALGSEFRAAFRKLLKLGGSQRVTLMCAEAVWWRCHRRIISDYLIAADQQVIHLMAPGRSQEAVLTKGAQIDADGIVTYPETDRRLDVDAQTNAVCPLCRYEELADLENERLSPKTSSGKSAK